MNQLKIHMKSVKRILTSVVAVSVWLTSWCSTMREKEDSLNRVLATTVSVADSLHIMCNLFDLAQMRSFIRSDSVAMLVLDMSRRIGDRAIEIEMMRNRANINASRIDTLDKLLKQAAKVPFSPERDEMVTLIKMLQNGYYARYATPEERRARLTRYMLNVNRDTMTIYGKIVETHNACVNVARLSCPEILVELEQRFGELVEQLPPVCRSLRSVYYVQAALDMVDAREYDEAMKADMRMLEVLDSLEAYYAKRGRPFRKFDSRRYVCYTRLLANWPKLDEERVQYYYDKVMEQVARDPRAAFTFGNMPIADIHMAMWRKDYAAAVPLLKRTLSAPGKPIDRDLLLRYAMEAARAVGDKDLLLSSLDEFVQNQEINYEDMRAGRQHALRIQAEVQQLERNNAEQQIQQSTSGYRRLLLIIAALVVAVVVLAVLLAGYVKKYRLQIDSEKTLSEANERMQTDMTQLRTEVDALEMKHDGAETLNSFRSDFMRNLTYEIETPLEQLVANARLVVDGVDGAIKPYCEDYVAQIEKNAQMLQSTFNDMIQLYELESDQVLVHKSTVNVNKVVATAVDVMMPLAVSNGVNVEMHLPDEDIIVTTDARRYQQVLQNLLRDSISRSPGGHVWVKLEKTCEEVLLSVESDGHSIETDMIHGTGEHGSDSKRSSLVLSASRMVARFIGASLYVSGEGRVKNTFVLVLKIA